MHTLLRRTLAASALLLSLAAPALAARTFYISPMGSDSNPGTSAQPFKTIQQGINNAGNGDTVTLKDGTYTGPGDVDLDFGGYNITVNSVNGASHAIIDCGGSSSADHRAFLFRTNETAAAISSITIKNGYESNIGGVIDVESGCTVKLSSLVLSGNNALDGGAIYNNGTLMMMNCVLSGNTGRREGGSIENRGTATITGCTFTGNAANDGDGGGVDNVAYYNGDPSTLTLTDCTFDSNTAVGGGGGVLNGNIATLTDCTFNGNISNGDGGGLNNYDNGTATVTGCTFTQNMSIGNGGGATAGTQTTFTGCTFSSNTAQNNGGAFYTNAFQSVKATNCVFSGNMTMSGNGGAVYNGSDSSFHNTPLTIQFCTFKDNTAAGTGAQGGAIENDGTVIVIDDILYGDTATTGAEIGIALSGNPVTTVTYTDIQGGLRDTGNINADPMFVNAAGGDLRLKVGSACLSAGIAIDEVTTDKNGATRHDPPSIGAYENAVAPPAHQWTATALSAGANGSTTLLWNKADGAASFWKVAANGAVSYSATYGPFAGYTCRALAASPDGSTRLLWTNTDGRASVWTVSVAGGISYSPTYGPFAGWTANALTLGTDGNPRLLWNNSDGRASVWTLKPTGVTYSPTFGPFAGWTAAGMAAAPNNAVRLLWDNADGHASFWMVPASGAVTYSATYGPFAGWTCKSIGVGSDNATRLLWTNTDGHMSLWTVSGSAVNYGTAQGPFAGWSAGFVSTGVDNVSRVLWTNTDGRASFWKFGAGSAITYSATFGPF